MTHIADDFAAHLPHQVRRGGIGIVGSSSAALREAAIRVHGFGGGLSRVIDASYEQVSGAAVNTLLGGIQALLADPSTSVIVVVSTRVTKRMAEAVVELLAASPKPAVVCLLGAEDDVIAFAAERGIQILTRTKPAALAAALASGIDEATLDLHPLNWPLIDDVRSKLRPTQRYIRGLFSSAATCEESALLAAEVYDDVYSSVTEGPLRALPTGKHARAHTFLAIAAAYGLDPCAMRDPAVVTGRFLAEAAGDQEVGVVVLDFILGADAPADPVGIMLPAILEAKSRAGAEGRHLEILGYLLGVDGDPQDFAGQAAQLDEAGVTWASSSTNTGLLAREFVRKL